MILTNHHIFFLLKFKCSYSYLLLCPYYWILFEYVFTLIFFFQCHMHFFFHNIICYSRIISCLSWSVYPDVLSFYSARSVNAYLEITGKVRSFNADIRVALCSGVVESPLILNLEAAGD